MPPLAEADKRLTALQCQLLIEGDDFDREFAYQLIQSLGEFGSVAADHYHGSLEQADGRKEAGIRLGE